MPQESPYFLLKKKKIQNSEKENFLSKHNDRSKAGCMAGEKICLMLSILLGRAWVLQLIKCKEEIRI